MTKEREYCTNNDELYISLNRLLKMECSRDDRNGILLLMNVLRYDKSIIVADVQQYGTEIVINGNEWHSEKVDDDKDLYDSIRIKCPMLLNKKDKEAI